MSNRLQWLIEKGCDVTIGENSGFNALDAAAYRGSPRLVKALLDAGLDPYRAAPRDGYLAMHRCCFSHQTNGKQLEALMEFDKVGALNKRIRSILRTGRDC